MDPLTSLSLVANIAAFVDFGFKIVAAARQVKSSATGTTTTNANAEVLTINLRAIAAKIKDSRFTGDSASNDPRLSSLVAECERLSEELLRLLSSLKAKKPGSRRHVLSIAFRNMMKRSERDELEARLDRCRNQLQLEIAQRTSEKSLQRLESIAATGECQTNELNAIKHSLHDLHQLHSPTATKLDTASFQGLTALLKLCGQAFESVALSKLLASIGFEKMTDRLENIAEAHATTFNWLLDASEAVDPKASLGNLESAEAQEWLRFTQVQDLYRKTSRETLTSWLAKGNGIFHIFGKPGSGKSTLLKHLLRHPIAQSLLEDWAGKKMLVKCSFFFWKGGSDGQKTFSGLYRSLLCSVLKQCPELAPIILPAPWQASLQGANVEMTDSQARAAFLDIIGQDEVFTHRKFVLFIDGLDEFEGDDVALVRTLLGWTQLRPESIKICVSSRELPLFQERFSSYPKLRLHEVTSLDIMGFVKSTLEENEDLSSAIDHSLTLRLGQKIIQKAEGVFLWVSLVLRVVERGLLHEDDPRDLEAKIDGLPSELEELFGVIFKAIETESHPIDRRRAMITLSLCMTRTKCYLADLLLYQLSFLDDYESDCDFLFKIPGPEVVAEDEERLRRCRKQVNGRCRGLVSVTSPSPSEPEDVIPKRRAELVTITHRSLLEFFARPEVSAVVEFQTRGFNTTQFSCRSFVAQQITELDPESLSENDIYRDVLTLLKIAWGAGRIDTSTVTQVLLDLERIPFLSSSLNNSRGDQSHEMDYIWPFLWREGSMSHFQATDMENRTVAQMIIFLAMKYGLPELLAPSEALKGGLIAQAAQNIGPQQLFMRIFDTMVGMRRNSWDEKDLTIYDRLLKCLAMCLHDGASPNKAVNWKHSNFAEDTNYATLWEILIWTSLCGCNRLNIYELGRQKLITCLLPIWVFFLAYGADTEFRLKVETRHSVEVYQDLISVVGLFGKDEEERFTPIFIPPSQNAAVDLAARQKGVLSLSDLVCLLFPNDFEKLLPLIDQDANTTEHRTNRSLEVLRSFGLDLDHWSPPLPAHNSPLFPEIEGCSVNKTILLRGVYSINDPERGVVVYSKEGIASLDPSNPIHANASLID
ncbi:hypothetical protein QBC40DRAFT_88698 [Triangularia verruculosa]|uniref:NACHT domain-containing protein n=1 Tax=Triangularia verruculosa TaxID=2587418 RepID=A0AAN7AUB6_9PEZI|nr:hypothetical protein QBC40DRAFT_88698 [Triangularia verruculosa]